MSKRTDKDVKKSREIVGRIMVLMEQNGISVKELAIICGVNQQTVYGWINSYHCPSLIAVSKMSKKLNVSIDYLVNGDGSTLPKSEICNTYETIIKMLEEKRKEFSSAE